MTIKSKQHRAIPYYVAIPIPYRFYKLLFVIINCCILRDHPLSVLLAIVLVTLQDKTPRFAINSLAVVDGKDVHNRGELPTKSQAIPSIDYRCEAGNKFCWWRGEIRVTRHRTS